MLSRFIRESLLQLFVSGILGVGLAIWAYINRLWSLPNAIVGGVLLICGVFYLMDRFGLGQTLKSKVRDWLDGSGYGIQTVPDANHFHYRMTDNINMVTDILQSKSGAPILVASGHHKASPIQLAGFNQMLPVEQQAFSRNVRLELLRYGIAYSDLKLDGDGVAFSLSIVPSPSLTSTEFLDRLMFVRSAARLYWELLMELNPTAPSSSASGPSGPTGPTGPVVN